MEATVKRETDFLPWFCMAADFFLDEKMMQLSFAEERHFMVVLGIKRMGRLPPVSGVPAQVRDRMVAGLLRIGNGVCARLKKKLIQLRLIDEDWQPLAVLDTCEARGAQARMDVQLARKKSAAMSSAERVRRYRQRQKEKRAAQSQEEQERK